jgi:hypothetical protein
MLLRVLAVLLLAPLAAAQPTPAPPALGPALQVLGRAAATPLERGEWAESLLRRTSLLDRARAELEPVEQGGDDYWAASAHFALGAALERFGVDLRAACDERGSQKDQYEPGCELAVESMMERALAQYEAGLARAARANGPWEAALREGIERIGGMAESSGKIGPHISCRPTRTQ